MNQNKQNSNFMIKDFLKLSLLYFRKNEYSLGGIIWITQHSLNLYSRLVV